MSSLVSRPRVARISQLAVRALLATSLVACGGGGGPTAPAKVASVDVTPAGLSKVAGESVQLTATPRDASGNALTGRTVAWISGTPAVATVNTTGMVTTLTAGTVSISAAVEGLTGSVSITVTPPPVATVTLTPATVSVPTGTTTQMSVVPRSADGTALTGRAATWTSATPAVATVSASGVVSGVTPGTSIVTVAVEGKSATALVTVTLNPCSLAASVSMNVGQTINGALAATDCPFVDGTNGPDGTYFDIILFDVTTAATIQMDMVSTAFDAYLFYYQWNGSQFIAQDQDDNGGGGTNARMTKALTIATYMIFANSLNANGFGPYTVTVKVPGSIVGAGNPFSPVRVRSFGRINSAQFAQLQRQFVRARR